MVHFDTNRDPTSFFFFFLSVYELSFFIFMLVVKLGGKSGNSGSKICLWGSSVLLLFWLVGSFGLCLVFASRAYHFM